MTRLRAPRFGGQVLLALLAATASADPTYTSTAAVGLHTADDLDAAAPLKADASGGASVARLRVVAGAGGALTDELRIDFPTVGRPAPRPFVLWTNEPSARLDLSGVSWSGGTARRAASATDPRATSPAAQTADLAWASGVADRVPPLGGATPSPSSSFAIDAVSSPEPAAAALFALGAACVAAAARRRRSPGR